MPQRLAVVASASAIILAGCALLPSPTEPTATSDAHATPTTAPITAPAVEPSEGASPAVSVSPEPTGPYARPSWLHTIELEIQDDGYGERKDTPKELRDRQLEPRPWLPDPETDEFEWTIKPVPDEIAKRASWEPGCPVELEDLSYLTLTFWGFDQKPHTGEMLIHQDHAWDVMLVFEKIYEARFPIEEMRVISSSERDAHATGDQNITSGFTCREVVGAPGVWSEHAKGLAVDINPFHNPYYKEDLIYPELAKAYLDREWKRPGMVEEVTVVFEAFEEIGWSWGGHWAGREDWMHFSAEGG